MKTIFAGLLASLVLIAAPAANAAQLLVNGGFENGLFGWTFSPFVTQVIADPGAPADDLLSFSGWAGSKASISQAFTTDAGDIYDVSFSGGVFGTGIRQVGVYMDNRHVGTFSLAPSVNSSGFTNFSWSFMGAGGTQRIQFDVVTAQGASLVFDDISIAERIVASVPEPSTWAMMILGFGAVGASLRNRRRRIA